MRLHHALVLFGCLAAGAAAQAATSPALVICAPGYPGTTQEAQAAMDRLAAAVADSTGPPLVPKLQAVYYETEEGGLARLAQADAQLAIVPLPFYLKHRERLKLVPKLQAVTKDGEPKEAWSLVARKGRVTSPTALDGWEIVSLAAYAPAFVRCTALAAWGRIPDSVKLTPSGQALSALRRAAKDEKVAVLLDAMQSASLGSLPFASDLEVVARSSPLPSALVCTVGGRVTDNRAKTWMNALKKLGDKPGSAAVLDEVRLSRFVPLDVAALEAARREYDEAGAAAK